MLIGKSVIELTDVHTGQVEKYEDSNLVTEAVSDVLNANIMGVLYDSTAFNNSNGENWMLPLNKNIMGGILLYQNEIEEREDNIYAPLTNPLIGYASDDANNTTDIRRGSRNLTESKVVDGGYRFVWDFATSQANGTISAICLSNTLAGKGTQFSNNYMVRLGSYSCERNVYATEAYRDNKRIFVKEGYRLEMTTYYNSTQAVLREYKDDFIHASLTERPLMRVVLEPENEVSIELGHYPMYTHYTGGSKDGTETPYSSNTDVRNYLFHGADGKWHGIVRRDNQTFDRVSSSREYYNHTGYEWFMDTVDNGKCTTQKIVTPSGITEFYSIGMSGKWLMCYTGNKLYRIDTTNVANIELVPDFEYVSSTNLTYVIDDDMVINGWYFYEGEPKLYLRETADASYNAWGRGQMARYKTFAVREWMYRYSDWYGFLPVRG